MDGLNAWDRLLVADELVSLVADAIRLRHPQAHRFERVTVDRVLRMDDARLLAARDALEAWVEQAQSGDLDRRQLDEHMRASVALTGGPARVAP